MYLRSLSIHGFKSFAEPTEIELEPGLTAIVGPNGCGKSNVIDAIRWVLGEQSARSLRGGVMQDVIFNGAGRRGPLGLAEVTLKLSNKDRTLGIERDEVRVTRRLYRDGQSEYLLNGDKVRLKDIRELLLDTGAGASAAVFVEQGKIDALLQASPRERRQVLEEAAGIGRYKIRKREAQARLEEVSNDRARLTDLLREVTARAQELGRQAKKAKRFVELRDTLVETRRALAVHRRARLARDRDDATTRGAQAAEQAEQDGAELERVRVVAMGLKDEVSLRERRVRELELELRDVTSTLKLRREQAQEEGRRAAELEDDAKRAAYQVNGLHEKIARLDREIEAGKKAREEQESADHGAQESARALEASLQALDARAKALSEALEHARSKLMDALQQEARTRNRIAELDARARVLYGREERLGRKLEEVEASLTEREDERTRLDAEVAAADARVVELDAALDRATERRDGAEVEIRDLEESFLGERRALDQMEARLAVIEQLDREGQGLEPGARAIAALAASVQAGDAAAAALPDELRHAVRQVIGPLTDQLGVDPDYAPAIEALLGTRAQWVLARSREASTELIGWLGEGERGRGRASILALDTFLESADAAPSLALSRAEQSALEDLGFLGWASALAAPRVDARPVLERLLAGACICEDLDSALALLGRAGIQQAATLEGLVVTASGLIEGGTALTGGRIGRQSERRQLEADRQEQQANLESMRQALARAREVERSSARELEALRKEHQDQKLTAFAKKRDREEKDRGLLRVREEARLTAAELAEVRADREVATSELEELTEQAIALREEAAEEDEAARARADAVRAVEGERDKARDALALARVELARGAEQWEALKRAAARAEAERKDAERELQGLCEGETRLGERAEEARTRAAQLAHEIERLGGSRESHDAALTKVKAELTALKATLSEARARESALSDGHRKAQGAAETAARDRKEAETRLTELAQWVEAELGEPLDALPGPAAPNPGDPPFSEVEAEREVGALKRQLQAIGAVNLEALEEHAQVEDRRVRLERDTEDLAKAEENLRQTIRRLNDTSRRRFQETFDAVRGHFRDIFRKLFGGGTADLVLEPGACVLEAGVDIIARPPGKRARTISLLSGGERVLATASLLFAVFRAKPGPFCILDEVDAALDEHNVGRFVALVREFLDRSQIIVVTHNKKTMSAADALYGITMPEPGVSTPVSVRMTERARDGAAAAATAPADAEQGMFAANEADVSEAAYAALAAEADPLLEADVAAALGVEQGPRRAAEAGRLDGADRGIAGALDEEAEEAALLAEVDAALGREPGRRARATRSRRAAEAPPHAARPHTTEPRG